MRPTTPQSARRSIVITDGARTPLTPTTASAVPRVGHQKNAGFSPSLDAMNQQVTPDQAQAQFDDTITQTGYQRFGSKFPDLVPHLVTLRLLASDVEAGTAFGAFVLDIGGRAVYVPMVVNDSRFEDFDIVYDKATDQFAPLTLAQLRYLRNRGTNAMGSAQKLPQSVPTDIDIRSLMLPPETGRYSYASAPLTDADAQRDVVYMTPDVIKKTAGFIPNLEYTHPRTAIQEEVLKHLAHSAPEVFDHLPEEQRAEILAQAGDEDAISKPHVSPEVPEGREGPPPGTIRLASAQIDADLHAMLRKVATAKTEMSEKRANAPTKLLTFLENSPNAVKLAFANTVQKRRDLGAQALKFYGVEKLASACRVRPSGAALLAEKRAGVTEIPFRLSLATKDDQVDAFGPDSGKAMRGVKLRGYYYRTEGMPPNRAVVDPTIETVQLQRPESGEAGAGLSGVLMLRKRTGERQPALVISQPYNLTYGDAWESRYVVQPRDTGYRTGGTLLGGQTDHVDERGRKNLVIFGDKSYACVDCSVFGDPVPENVLEGTALWDAFKSLAGSTPSVGKGTFLSKRGTNIDGTEVLTIKTVTTGPNGVVRGTFDNGRPFECDPTAALEQMINTGGYDTLYIPASWKWLPLGENRNGYGYGEATNRIQQDFYLSEDDAAHAIRNAMVSSGERASVLKDGPSYMTSAAPGVGKPKVAALHDLATRYGISGGDAEALLKIADFKGKSAALILPRSGRLKQADAALEQAFGATLEDLQAQLQQLQGQIAALTGVQQRASQLMAGAPEGDPNAAAMGAQMTDPGMGAPAQGDAPMADPAAMPPAEDPAAAAAAPPAEDPSAAPPADPNAGVMPPADPAAAAAAAPPADPAAAAAPPPADPNAMPPGDPNAMPPGDPNAMPPGDPNAGMAPPPPAIDPQTGLNVDPQSGTPVGTAMATEGPAAAQVESQINPNYLQAAGALNDASVFDVGMLAELQRAAAVSQSSAALDALMPINTKDLGETVDDLGRALLNLYLRGSQLNEQLGVQTQARMIGQIRRSFLGLGELLLDLRAYKAGARATLGNI